jgi:hypothetical protein
MPDSLLSQLLDFGALGIFAGFLIWQHLGMQKRLDNLVDRFQAQLKDIDDGFEDRVEKMRARYDIVIENIRRECRESEKDLIAQRDALQDRLADLAKEGDRKLDVAIEKIDLGLKTMAKKYEEEKIERLARDREGRP